MTSFKDSPIEYIASGAMIIGGIIITTYISDNWASPVGGALTTIGGALFSYTASAVKRRKEALEILKPQLQSISRHLADAIAKLSKLSQVREDELPTYIAIDRVSQLVSSFYASLHELHLLSGSTTNFESLVETVEVCESTAEKLADITSNNSEIDKAEIRKLKDKLTIAKEQLRKIANIHRDTPTKREIVSCPYCENDNEANISIKKGPGVTLRCRHCLNTFHAHRLENGGTQVVPWGGDSIKVVDTKCPSCENSIRVNMKASKDSDVRFCLNCYERLTINDDGVILCHEKSTPVESMILENRGNRYILQCPMCESTFQSLYSNNNYVRGVCIKCQLVVEKAISS